MPTRLKRPSIIKQLSYTILLGGFLAYMGFSVISGQYGINSQKEIKIQTLNLKEQNVSLQNDIENLKKKIALFDSEKLDPDILTERARELLSMAHENDRVVLIP